MKPMDPTFEITFEMDQLMPVDSQDSLMPMMMPMDRRREEGEREREGASAFFPFCA